MVCWKAMARKRTVDDSMTYCFPWKHPMARLRGIEFRSNATKNGLVDSALWASPLGHKFGLSLSGLAIRLFGAIPRKHNPNVDSACGPRLSSLTNAPAPTFSLVQCPSHGLGVTVYFSTYVFMCKHLSLAVLLWFFPHNTLVQAF